MRAAVPGDLLPIGLAHNQIINSAEHKLSMSVFDGDSLVAESSNFYRAKAVPNFCRITAEIVVIAVAIPRAKRRASERPQRIEKRTEFAGVAGHDISGDRDKVRLEVRDRGADDLLQQPSMKKNSGVDIGNEQNPDRIQVCGPAMRLDARFGE